MKNLFEVAASYVRIISMPLKAPFITAAGQKTETRNAVIEVKLHGGATGYGEASGSVVQSHLSAAALAGHLRSEGSRLKGKDARAWAGLGAAAFEKCGEASAAAAAVECALADAAAKQSGVALHELFGGAVDEIETDITISAGTTEAASRESAAAFKEGFRNYKIKVGTTFEADFDRVMAVWQEIRTRSQTAIILDGNQGMNKRSATKLVQTLLAKKLPIVLLEQPLPRKDWDGMKDLESSLRVPIAADESVRSPAEAAELIERRAADVINVKVAKTGLSRSLEIIALARAAGIKLMIGCMQESAKGLTPSVQLACGTGAFTYFDVDSDHLLAGGPAGEFEREGPRVRLKR